VDFDSLNSGVFLGLGLLLLLLERLPRRRGRRAPVAVRWLSNLGLMISAGMVGTWLFPDSLVHAAGQLESGLLRGLQLPLWLEIVVVFLLLDCWRYWEHRLLHEVPLLWRAHLVHHSDTAVDVTTAQRHHPLEVMLTTLLAVLLVFGLGISPLALAVYYLVAMAASLYTHTNLQLPIPLDRRLRRWLVTPSVHAVHHSARQPETDSNYGAVLSIWDRLFGTYTDPVRVQVQRVGLERFRSDGEGTLLAVLLQPFHDARDSIDQSAAVEQGPAVSRRLSAEWRRALGAGAVGLLLVTVAMWPTVVDLLTIWGNTDPYRYAWWVLPAFAWLAGWHYREAILALTPRPDFVGLPVMAFAVLLWLTARVVDIKFGQHLAWVLALQGIALSVLGLSVYRRLLPLMGLLFLLVPFGDLVQPLLRALTVQWLEWFAFVAGLPLRSEGFVLHIGDYRYVVIDACSGLGMFNIGLFLGYCYGLMLFRAWRKVIALALAGAVIGVLSNAARVCLIVAIDQFRGSQMDLAAHGDIQLVVMLASLGVLLYLVTRCEREGWPETAAAAASQSPGHRSAVYAPVLAGLLAATAVLPVRAMLDRAETANDVPGPLQQIALRYPGSQPLVPGVTGAQVISLPLTDRLEALVMVSPDAAGRLPESLIRPEDESVWRHARTDSYRDCGAQGCVDFVHRVWKQKGSEAARHSLHAYFIGEQATRSRLLFRLASGWNRLLGAPESNGLVAFRFSGAMPAERALSNAFYAIRETTRSPGAAPRIGAVLR
jgi:exosortase